MKPVFTIAFARFGKTYSLTATLSEDAAKRRDEMFGMIDDLGIMMAKEELSEGYETLPQSFKDNVDGSLL